MGSFHLYVVDGKLFLCWLYIRIDENRRNADLLRTIAP